MIPSFLIYLVGVVIGIGSSRGINNKLFGSITDDSTMMCFLIGAMVTTFFFILFRKQIARAKHHLLLAFIIGILSFTPGYLVVALFSVLHI